jgi:tRNA(fMet)-specific endonuclease VapC
MTRDESSRRPFETPSEETALQFERLAFDANAAIDSLRPLRPFPHPLRAARQLFMPLFVLAELRLGVARSQRRVENAAAVDNLADRCHLLVPDVDTTDFYVRVRSEIARVRIAPQSFEKREGFGHDLWIAALCLQHNLPLLTNDSLFEQVSGLHVVKW